MDGDKKGKPRGNRPISELPDLLQTHSSLAKPHVSRAYIWKNGLILHRMVAGHSWAFASCVGHCPGAKVGKVSTRPKETLVIQGTLRASQVVYHQGSPLTPKPTENNGVWCVGAVWSNSPFAGMHPCDPGHQNGSPQPLCKASVGSIPPTLFELPYHVARKLVYQWTPKRVPTSKAMLDKRRKFAWPGLHVSGAGPTHHVSGLP